MEQDFNIKHWANPCPKYNCRKETCKCGMKFVSIPAVLGDDSENSDVAPKNGLYCNTIVRYEANGHIYIYSKEGIPTLIYSGDYKCDCMSNIVVELPNGITEYSRGKAPISYDDVKKAFEEGSSIFFVDYGDVHSNIYTVTAFSLDDAIRSIKVERVGIGIDTAGFWLIQSDHSDSWESIRYFPSVYSGDYYTKTQVDTLLTGKQNELTAGSNISIAPVDDDLVISATDTTYSNFVGTDGNTGGTAGLVPAPATTDVDKFLKSDGTWDTAGGGSTINVVQTTGNSQTDVMSQNAVTSLVFANPGTNTQIRIGSTGTVSNSAIRIGSGGQASNTSAVSIGNQAQAQGQNSVALGPDTLVTHRGSVALGSSAQTTVKGQIMVGTTNTYDGYNSTNYRIISGVHDGQSTNDAVTVSQVNSVIDSINSALSINIPHIGA